MTGNRNGVDIKTLTLNARGLRDNDKRMSLFHWINKLEVDVVFLQETHVTENFTQMFDKSWPGKAFHSTTDSANSRGVAILLKTP